jgi:hypothetical protein
MKTWYALLNGPLEDQNHVKRLFTASGYEFDDLDGKFALGAQALESFSDREDVIDAATELVASLNTTLRLSVDRYTGFELHGLLEKRQDGTTHRIMFAKGAAFGIGGASAIGIAGSLSDNSQQRRTFGCPASKKSRNRRHREPHGRTTDDLGGNDHSV